LHIWIKCYSGNALNVAVIFKTNIELSDKYGARAVVIMLNSTNEMRQNQHELMVWIEYCLVSVDR